MSLYPPSSAFIPFTPRAVGIDYISEPEGPIVYISPGSTSPVQCPLTYPFDPRNLSLAEQTS